MSCEDTSPPVYYKSLNGHTLESMSCRVMVPCWIRKWGTLSWSESIVTFSWCWIRLWEGGRGGRQNTGWNSRLEWVDGSFTCGSLDRWTPRLYSFFKLAATCVTGKVSQSVTCQSAIVHNTTNKCARRHLQWAMKLVDHKLLHKDLGIPVTLWKEWGGGSQLSFTMDVA